MATRIHNFSYSGTTGLLQFVPCVGDEKACKLYIKSIAAPINVSGQRIIRQITLSTKSADNSLSLMRAHWSSSFYGGSAGITTINMAGGCTQVVADWRGTESQTETFGEGYWPGFEKTLWSGKGEEQWDPVGWLRYNIPEYFYMKPGDTLTLNGYTGTFHIELMAISES